MAIRKGREPSIGLEALGMFSQFDIPEPGKGTTVHDLGRRQAFMERLHTALDESLTNQARTHGKLVEGMFGAVVVALGSIRMIKEEDTGGYYFDDAGGQVKPPDFRVVREDGERLVVEVKSVPPRDGCKPQSMRTRDLEEEQLYADMTGARLVIAHYWSAVNRWTLVDPAILEPGSGRSVLTFETAMMANEMAYLGDATIGTRPPLRFSVLADLTKPEKVHEASITEREIAFTIGAVELSCAGLRLTDSLAKRIAFFLMLYGGWEMEQEVTLGDDNRLVRVDFVHTPVVPDEEAARKIARQGFAVISPLSSMYSALYFGVTLTEEGSVRKMRHEPDPGALGDLIPAEYWERESRDLPIWKLVLEPSIGPAAPSRRPATARSVRPHGC